MRCSVASVVVAVALAGCGPEFAVVPQGGLPRAVSTVGPITMMAFASQWEANPDDLADYMTPIAVELYNAGPYEVRVTYADFALKDERGFRYAAINPFIPSALSEAPEAVPPKLVLLAGRSGGGGGGHGGGFSGGHGISSARFSGGGRGGVMVGPHGGRRWSYGGYGRGHGWAGYQIAGGLRGYYGAGWSYWLGPAYYPAYYSDWVLWWGPRYYPSERPSADVLGYALPEGVLAPGGRVSGFLYFQKATDHGRALDLDWNAYEARSGAFLATTQLPLEIVNR